MKYDVYGVGNALVDIQARVSDNWLATTGFDKGIMTLVDDAQQKTVLDRLAGTNLNRCAGGSAANTIFGVADFGGKAAYVGKVANDEVGEFFLHDMRKMGVTIEELSTTLTADVELLKKVLTSHVIAGKVMAADTAALNGMEADLVSGEKAKVVSADGVVSFTIGTSTATVATPDIEAANGVIHSVDMPLLPLAMQK